MKTYKLTIEYLGTHYVGWQIQPNGVSIQQRLEEALYALTGKNIPVVGSGRTDSGVHALGQVASCSMNTTIPCDKLPFAINNLLPDDIRVIGCEEVDDTFNARYSAKRKTYLYKIYYSRFGSPLRDTTHMRVTVPLDIERMREGARYLLGEHDFKCFVASGSDVKTTVRTIYRVDVLDRGDEIFIEVEGNGFLYNMVRIIVGTLVRIGSGKAEPIEMQRIIESEDRTKAYATAPAQGLYLKSVVYDDKKVKN